ncbi:MAG: efflux transporter outer membrane subunit [Kiritimatiellae bacterium]|nr:efflux transporter outer membrane subunit [Kiritimatiellia bacterium]
MNIKTLTFASLALAGCSWMPSVGPDYEKSDDTLPGLPLPDAGLPTTNRTAVGEYKPAEGAEDTRVVIGEADLKEWWRKFDDPILVSLVDEAIATNLSFRMAQERLVAARWRAFGAGADWWPKLNATASGVRTERGPNTSSMVGSGNTLHRDVFSTGFDASWEIDIFGGTRRSVESAKATAEAAEWSLEDMLVSLTSEVGRNYIDLRTTQRRIDVARTNLVLQTETYDILKSRMDSGIGDELAVNQSKYVVEQTRAAIPPLLAQEERLKNALAILAGCIPGDLEKELESVEGRDWLLPASKLESIPLNLIRTRPDVRVAERQLAAQVAAVGVAESLWYPKLFINGSIGLESTHPDKLFKRNSLYGSIGPAVSWPIFQGGNIVANIKAEEAAMNEKALAYELALDTAYGEVRDAYAAYTREYHRYRSLESAVKAAQDAVTISKDLYRNGLKDFTAVIDAQRSLLSLEEALVISRGTITTDLIALYKALGGGLAGERD